MAVFLPSLIDDESQLNRAVETGVSGALSYNGQRCTALKLFFVPKGSSLGELVWSSVQRLRVGLPWDNLVERGPVAQITPLPNLGRVQYMKELLDDAREKGAEVRGGEIVGGSESTLMKPAVVIGVKEGMRLFTEEQFGPIVCLAEYDPNKEIREQGACFL